MLGFDDENAIWHFQTSYLNAFSSFAYDVFRFIDVGLKPEILIIGVDNSVRYDFGLPRYNYPLKKHNPAPEKPMFKIAQQSFRSNLDSLNQIFEIAKGFEKDLPSAAANYLPSTKAKIASIRLAILQILSEESTLLEKTVFVSGEPATMVSAEISGYTMFPVLLLDKRTLTSRALPPEFWPQKVKDPDLSYTHVAARLILRECVLALRDPHKGPFREIIERSSEELLHRAASTFLQSVGRILSKQGGPNLFDSCNLVSSLPYEGTEGVGSVILTGKDRPPLKMALELERPFPLKDFRKVRKFLELSKQGLFVVCDGTHIVGLYQKLRRNEDSPAMLVIEFTGHYRWKLRVDEHTLLSVAYNQPVVERSKIDEDKFRSDLPRIFDGIHPEQVDHISTLVQEGIRQKHGTMLVISDDAPREAQRLASQALIVKPVKLSAHMMVPLSAIDGAILMDRQGVCYGLGVILDGQATKQGDSSRGARYNSAIKYFQNKSVGGLMIIIISEDGMVNLIPNLMPQVSHAVITRNIEKLQELTFEVAPDEKSFNKVMSDLFDLKFYLTATECKAINQSSRRVAKKIKGSLFINFFKEALKPNKDMNESYYLDRLGHGQI